jgi:hypothetical protein
MRNALLIFLFFPFTFSYGQTVKEIEQDLLKHFEKQRHYAEKKSFDAVDAENKILLAKFLKYTENSVATLTYNFPVLQEKNLCRISTSPDSLFRIYNWDDGFGGTMRSDISVFQYSNGKNVFSEGVYIPMDEDHGVSPGYSSVLNFIYAEKKFYMGIQQFKFSSRDVATGVKVFSFNDKGRLNDSVLEKSLILDYDYMDALDLDTLPEIHFDEKKAVLFVPRVIDNRITKDYLRYIFNGKYFECREFENALDEVMLTLKDTSVHNVVNLESNIIKDSKTAIAVAEPILFGIYGKDNIENQKPYDVQYVEVYWVVSGTLKEGVDGGTFLIIMDSRNGQVLRITHGK